MDRTFLSGVDRTSPRLETPPTTAYLPVGPGELVGTYEKHTKQERLPVPRRDLSCLRGLHEAKRNETSHNAMRFT